jgi:hypothetical protein
VFAGRVASEFCSEGDAALAAASETQKRRKLRKLGSAVDLCVG